MAAVYAAFAADFLAAQRAFAAAANFFFVDSLIGFRAPFAAGEATGEALADFTVFGATAAAFLEAAFTALFFFAHRFCCASAIRWRASELMTRFAALGLVPSAGEIVLVAVLAEETIAPLRASSAAIAWSMRSRWTRRSVRNCAVSIWALLILSWMVAVLWSLHNNQCGSVFSAIRKGRRCQPANPSSQVVWSYFFAVAAFTGAMASFTAFAT